MTTAHRLLADPRLALGLILALTGLAIALLIVWRREALRQAADPARHAWFAFALRVQLLVSAGCFILPAAGWMAEPSRALAGMFPAWAPFAYGWNVAGFVLAPFGLALVAVCVTGDVERRLRGSGAGWRERVTHLSSALVMTLLPVVGLLAAGAALSAGRLRAAVIYAFGGVLGALWFASVQAGWLGLKPEAATAGPLRDRLFELAAAAKVRVKQVYVISSARMKSANAFAVRGGNVILTAQLLEELSRRQVDAVVAHELAHLRHRHPQKLGLAFAVPFVIVQIFAWSVLPPQAMAPAFALGGILGWMSLRGWSRRFEYQADRGAIELTNDAAALIQALVRIAALNATPLDWGRRQEWLLTHPSVRRRARALAAAGHLPLGEAEALLSAPPDDAERWTLPAAALEPVFGSAARRARGAATSWSLLAASAAAPALTIALLRWSGVHGAWPLVFALALLVAFFAALITIDLLATAGYAGWERELAERLRHETGDGRCVGLAPGAVGMTYEGFADWDLGYLDLDPVTLRYVGERARFALERTAIVSIELVPGLPGWLPAPRVAIRWRAADGAEAVFSVRSARSRALHEIPRDSLRLLAELRQWHAEPAPAGVRALGTGEPPRRDAVTGTPLAELAAPRTLVPVCGIAAGLALLAALAAGLPLDPAGGPGALEAMAASVVAVVALRVPLWRAGRATARGARRGAPRAA